MLHRRSPLCRPFAVLLAAVAHLVFASSPGSLEGKVIGLDGIGIPQCLVYAIPENAMNQVPLKTTTDDSGHFRFQELASNQYYLDASKEDQGYIYSIFSFFIMPGQEKPKVEVKPGENKGGVIVKLGTKAAYLEIVQGGRKEEHSRLQLTFVRPDLPGYYKRSFSPGESVPVPAVPFRLSAIDEESRTWSYRGLNNVDIIEPRPGEHIRVKIVFANGKQESELRQP